MLHTGDGQGSHENSVVMNELDIGAAAQAAVRTHQMPVNGSLRPYVSALVGLEMDNIGPVAMAAAPHDAMVIGVPFAHNRGANDIKGELGANTLVNGIRDE